MNKLASWLALLSGCCALVGACGQSAQGGDTQTNWLSDCTSDAECNGLECVCGRCTKRCSTSSDCATTPLVTSCQPAGSEATSALCAAGEPSALCLSGCDDATPCAEGETCLGGACIPEPNAAGDAADFCPRLIDAHAAYIERCGCGAAAAERFRQENLPNCEPGGTFDAIAQKVAAGELIYDAAAADALLARYDDPEPLCVEEIYRALRLDSIEVYSYAGTFTGTRQLGSPCTMPVSYKGGISDCAEGVCAGTEAGSGVCVELVGPGEACDASGDDNLNGASARVCIDRRQPDGDGEYESAFDSLRCVPTSPGATTRICARDLAIGEECESGDTCESGYCATGGAGQGVCAAKLADGEPCESGAQCRSGACRFGEDPQVCGAPLGEGQACFYEDSACESGFCADDGGTGSCGPAATQAPGEACTVSAECISAGHGSSRDSVCVDGSCMADICVSYLE